MLFPNRRASARHLGWPLLALCWLATPPRALAQDASDTTLDLDAAANLAVVAQPLLESLDAQARAARASGVSARQLPDPRLMLGVLDLPVDGDAAGSFTRDQDTQIQIGLQQEFPRAEKRRLRGELKLREADRVDATQQLVERTVRRDASLAWLDLWRAERTVELTRQSLGQATMQRQLAAIALKTGSATQAEYLAAKQDDDRLQDEVRGAEQSVGHARNTLSRWIGDAAYRPVTATPPTAPPLPPLDAVLAAVDRHPQLRIAAARRDSAQADTALARAAYRPDWRVELAYAARAEYPEMLSLQVGIDLPLFSHQRQDQDLAAALAQAESAEADIEDVRRQLRAEARLDHHDAERLAQRLQDYDTTLLPQSRARIEAATAGWRSGRGRFGDVIDARREALALQLAYLALIHDRARHFAQLTYLGVFDTEAKSRAAENAHD